MAITVSIDAANRVKQSIVKRGRGIGLRLGVKTSGCSGLAYKIEFIDEAKPDDIIFETNEIKIFVDPKSLQYIDGMMLDYTREGLQEGFKFVNPNVKDECGCGKSFTV